MNDTEKARFQPPLGLVEWLDTRIAQQVEQHLEQRLVEERERWRCLLVDLMVAERERLLAFFEKECRSLIDRVEADLKKVAGLVELNNEQSQRLIAKATGSVDRLFDRLQAKLDEYATTGMCRPDDDSQPPPSTH